MVTLSQPARYLNGQIAACADLAIIGLTEILAVWVNPDWGFALYGLLLVALICQAAFSSEGLSRRWCLALTLIPLLRIVGFSVLSLTVFPVWFQYLILAVALLAAAALVIHYLALSAADLGLTLDVQPWSTIGYLPIVLLALALGLPGLFEYQFVQPLGLTSLSIAQASVGTLIAIQLVGLLLGFVEALIFYGILLRVGRDLLGEPASLLYVAVLMGILQFQHLSWSYGLIVFLMSLLFGWVALRTHTIYAVALARGFAIFYVCLAPILFR